MARLNYNYSRRRAENGDGTTLRYSAPTMGCIRRGSNPDVGFPSVRSRSPDSDYLCITRRTGFVSPNPSNRRVIRTEWSDEAMTDNLHNNQGWRDSGVRHVRESWNCLHSCSIYGDGGTTNGVATMPPSVQLTTVVRGSICPTRTSDGETITPEELITVISNRNADVETVPEISDIRYIQA